MAQWQTTAATIWVIVEYIIKIIALGTVPENRRPSSSTAWLLLIFLLPVIGLPLYVFLGSPWIHGKRRQQQEEANRVTSKLTAVLPDVPEGAEPSDHLRSILRMNRLLTGLPCVTGEVVDLHTDAPRTYEAMARAIDEARHHVHVEVYIQSWDEVTDVFYSALERAAARGVDVRLLVDHLGSRKYPGWRKLGKRWDAAGIQWWLMMPLLPLHRRFRRPDLRNHRKLVIIDGERAFIGSHNIIDPTYRLRSNIRAGRTWHDLSIEITGQAVAEAQAVFAMDWFFESGQVLQARDFAPTVLPASDSENDDRALSASSLQESGEGEEQAGSSESGVRSERERGGHGREGASESSTHATFAAATGPRPARLPDVTLSSALADVMAQPVEPVGSPAPQSGRENAVVNAMQIIPSGPGYPTEPNLRLFLSLIQNATKRVSITSPYFVPDEALLSAITTAAYRGVEVELFVGKESDHLIVNHAQRSYYAALLAAGVHIYRYPAPAVLHAKYLTVDGEVAVIGSSNMDFRSFTLNYEVMLLAFGGDLDDLLRANDAYHRSVSTELTAEEWAHEPWYRRYMDNVFRLLSAVL